ncbi:MAG: HAD family hydrolase [Pontibacterium sp.]
MIKCITFDLDDTLWAVEPVIDNANATLFKWLAEHAPDFAKKFSVADIPALREEAILRWPEIAHHVSNIRLRLLELGFEKAGYSEEEGLRLAEEAFGVFFDARQQVTLFEHVEDVLKDLRSKGYILGALSNGNADIGVIGLSEYFDFHFTAEDVGKEKPHPAMFESMLAHSDVKPNEVIHVGDDPVRDVQAAANMGIWTVWVNVFDACAQAQAATRTITCLSELPQVIADITLMAQERAKS